MENCIFCKIIKGEVPCYKIFENDKVMAFLDINPVAEGHTLIVPKKHYNDIFEIDEDYLSEVANISKKIAIRLKDCFGAEGINIFQANRESGEQAVFHYHMHIIPRRKEDGISFSKEMTSKAKEIKEVRFKEIKEALKFI